VLSDSTTSEGSDSSSSDSESSSELEELSPSKDFYVIPTQSEKTTLKRVFPFYNTVVSKV
jgi:hypothetical protein